MPINSSQQEKLKAWLDSKGVRPQCGACGSNDWAPGDIVAAPRYSSQGLAIGGPTVPMVQLVCSNCAHLMLFAAVPIGIL